MTWGMPRRRLLPPVAPEDVEQVPAKAKGARVLSVLAALLTLIGVGLLWAAVALPSVFHERLGIAERVDADVVGRVFSEGTPGPRRYGGGNCDFWAYTVAWEGQSGRFTTCGRSDRPHHDVGDTVSILTVPWTDEISADDSWFWPLALLLGGGCVVWFVGRLAWRHDRLARGKARGPRYLGTVVEASRGKATAVVRLPDDERLRLTFALKTGAVMVGQRVEVWASRLTRAGSPRGPWVLRTSPTHGTLYAATHAKVLSPEPKAPE